LHRDSDAPFVIAAAISSLAGRELAFVEELLAAPEWRERGAGLEKVLQTIATSIAQSAQAAQLDRLLQIITGGQQPKWQRLALLNGIGSSSVRKVDALPPALEAGTHASDPEIAKGATELMTRLTWPGKFGAAPPPLTAAEQQLFEKGRIAYSSICAACHQPDGRGLPGIAAPLIDSPWVLGPDTFLARIVLKGKVGKTSATMPPLEMLGNDTLASALTYIRRSWGHTAPPVSTATIGEMREAIILRSQPYTEQELEALRDGR
jgi:mono/diheme cytochrome c family protein